MKTATSDRVIHLTAFIDRNSEYASAGASSGLTDCSRAWGKKGVIPNLAAQSPVGKMNNGAIRCPFCSGLTRKQAGFTVPSAGPSLTLPYGRREPVRKAKPPAAVAARALPTEPLRP
ncbi:MAG: hypothetical protein KIT00_06100 [Rhodospirillales bacterium]|nr:hypothetical protein [Rhodospirillales bacterium]